VFVRSYARQRKLDLQASQVILLHKLLAKCPCFQPTASSLYINTLFHENVYAYNCQSFGASLVMPVTRIRCHVHFVVYMRDVNRFAKPRGRVHAGPCRLASTRQSRTCAQYGAPSIRGIDSSRSTVKGAGYSCPLVCLLHSICLGFLDARLTGTRSVSQDWRSCGKWHSRKPHASSPKLSEEDFHLEKLMVPKEPKPILITFLF
jgi:hypothetical protein